MKKQTKQLVTILIATGILLTLIFSGAFRAPGVIISVSEIQVRPEGYLEGNHIKGSYIIITGAVQYSEDWQILEFNNETLKKHPADWNGEQIWVKNEIKIQFKPQRPYYSREMKYVSKRPVVPKAYKNWMNRFTKEAGKSDEVVAPPLYSQHWEFESSDWQLHVPITLEIYVNNEKITTKTLNLLDIAQLELGHALNITTERGTIMIQSLGALQGKYYPPEWENIIWFNEKYFYLDSSAIRQALECPYPWPSGGGDGVLEGDYKNSYAYYWYGGVYRISGSGWEEIVDFNRYWTDDGSPYPYAFIMPGVVRVNGFAPGWTDKTDSMNFIVEPIAPPKFPEDKSSLPADIRGSLSLIEFLEKNGAIRPSLPSWIPSWDDMKVTLTRFHDLYSGRMYLYLPWSCFSQVITVKIPTELADAVVEVPKLANIKIEDFPDDLGEIATDVTVDLKLKQYANVASDGIVEIELTSPSDAYVAFKPNWFGTGPMEPNEVKDFSIQVINLGSPDKIECKGKITVKNSYGVETDSKEFKFTLLPRQGDYSLLTVKVQDESGNPVNGILVIVNYEGKSKSAYTSLGSVTFDFEGATPYVTISTQETEVYASATATHQMHEGYNEVILTVATKGKPETDWSWLFWILLTSIIIIILFTLYKKRRAFKA